jgi:hypothetical protein
VHRWFAAGFTLLWCSLHVFITVGNWREWFYPSIEQVMSQDNAEGQESESEWDK